MKPKLSWLAWGITGILSCQLLTGCEEPPTAATPDDPSYPEQWGYENVGMPDVWLTTSQQSGNPVTIAVIDTGIYAGGHPDLPPRSSNNARFLESGADIAAGLEAADIPQDCDHHGTHVSGTSLANTNNGNGVAGMLWNQSENHAVTHVSIRTLGCQGTGTLEDTIQGIYYAAGITNRHGLKSNQPADVINMSLSGSGACSASLEEAIKGAAAGSVVVVGAGNTSDDRLQQPASCPSVTFTVGATDRDNQLVSFSSYGFNDLSAPGSDIFSTFRDPDYRSLSGTSMATPHVSGAAAVLLQKNPNLTVTEIKALLVNNAQAFDNPRMGAGILRVSAAFDAATEAVPTETIAPNPDDRLATPEEMSVRAEFVPGEILVKYKQPERSAELTDSLMTVNTTMQESAANPDIPVLLRLTGEEFSTVSETALKRITLEQIELLLQSPEVVYAEPNYILRKIGTQDLQ